MDKKVKVSPLMRVKIKLIALQCLINDSYRFGLISKEEWQLHRKTIEEIRTIRIEKILKEMEENGDKASN
jgi:galactokinase/mevalonate kinase-like predicted kinase